MKTNTRKICLGILLLTTFLNKTDVTAQVGVMTNNPNKDAVLDLNNSSGTNTRGLLLPKVTLLSTDNASPMTTHVEGMRVYNTATAGTGINEVVPGVYYNNGTNWISESAAWDINGNSNTNIVDNYAGTKANVDFAIRTNNIERTRLQTDGKLLVGTSTIPVGGNNTKMVINNGTNKGALQIKDGTEGLNKILTSDVNGTASWKEQAVDAIFIEPLVNSGIDIPFNNGSTFRYTGSSITLPPGKWLITVNMLINKDSTTGSNESWWVRSTFSNSSTTMAISSDIVAPSTYVSGNLPSNSDYSMMFGTLVINNTSGNNKTYYYIAGNIDVINATGFLTKFGGVWAENNFMVQRLK